MSTGDESEEIVPGETVEEQAVVHQEQTETSGDARPSGKELRVELRRLASRNPPGTAELIQPMTTTGTRPRIPTITSAKSKYEIAASNLQEKMDHLEDQSRSGMKDSILRNILASNKQRKNAKQLPRS